MIAVVIPSSETVDAAIDHAERFGVVIRVCLLRGDDGRIRGNALVRG